MSSGSTVVSTQRSQGNCIFLNIKWNLLKGYSLTTWNFFVWCWGGAGREEVMFLLVSLAIFFPLLPSVDQVWLVHYFGAIASSLTLLEAAALEILSPTKGQDTLLPWGHDLCSISRSPDCLSCFWNCVSQMTTQYVA